MTTENSAALMDQPPQSKPSRPRFLGPLVVAAAVTFLLANLFWIFTSGFWEAQPRAKVSRVQSDMRSLSIALEAYFADAKAYPPFVRGIPGGAAPTKRRDFADALLTFAVRPSGEAYLVSPKGYLDIAANITAMPSDIFSAKPQTHFGYYTTGKSWVVFSAGPDRVYDLPDPSRLPTTPNANLDPEQFVGLTYDSTNGTGSRGDLFWFGGSVSH